MKKFLKGITDFIVNHAYVVLAVMLVLAGVSAYAATKVKINHDIMQYMPENSETSQGLDIMDDEFSEVNTSNYLIMFENLPNDQKNSTKEYLESVDGVKSVDYKDGDEYNREKDGNTYTLYSINVNGKADATVAANAYHEIHDHFKNAKNENGEDEYTFFEKGDVSADNGEVLNILIILIAVGAAMVILTIMSESFIEPWLYLFAILIGVVINKGTNLIFPNVSHITNAIAAILQMALSMDYAIMLSARYRQERATEPDKKKAMREALRYSFASISASSVTTIVGLIVLVFMSFTIGRDMGYVLSKGVFLSLVSIFTTLPAMLLATDKLIMGSKKHTPRIKMDPLGKFAYGFRMFAFPVFVAIFIASFFLKGNVGIEYTSSAQDKIKDVFDETNQIAVIYKNDDESKVSDICHSYENDSSVKQVLCYGNTINEPEKYNEIKAKASDLGSSVDVEDYLLKTLYYHYYNQNEDNKMTLSDFVTFVQNNIEKDKNFDADLSDSARSNIERLSNFVIASKMNKELSKSELASILEIDESKIDKLFVLYGANKSDSSLGQGVSNSTMTLNQFANFVKSDVLSGEYASELSSSEIEKINQLATFSDKSIINKNMTASDLAKLLGINETDASQIMYYYAYLNADATSTKMTVKDLANFISTNKTIQSQLTTTDKQMLNSLFGNQDLMAIINSKMTGSYTSSEFVNGLVDLLTKTATEAGSGAKQAADAAIKYGQLAAAATDPNVAAQYATAAKTAEAKAKTLQAQALQLQTIGSSIDKDTLTAKIGQIYKVYQAENDFAKTTLSPSNFVSFIINHSNDAMLKGKISSDNLVKLNLAKFIMDSTNNDTKFSAKALSEKFGIDENKLRLVYSLNYFKNVNTNPTMSIKTLIDFINSDVLTSAKYSGELNDSQKNDIKNATTLMINALNKTEYTSKTIYSALKPLDKSNALESNTIDLLFMYYGSLYDYNDGYTLTLESFVNYLHDNVLEDSRFSLRLDDNKRNMINDAKKDIDDAKAMLVGKNYSRAILNTNLAPEGDGTFNFIATLKKVFNDAKTTNYIIGNSPMAYEMSKTFNGEMDLITVLTMVSIFLVVAVTFKSILIPTILVLIIQAAVWITMSILSFTGSSVYFIALIIVQSILMGATIDYAILYTSYYLEHRGKQIKNEMSGLKLSKLEAKNLRNKHIKQAIIDSYNKSIHTIITSASVLVIVTFIVGNFDKNGSAIAAKICTTISEGTLCSAILILLILPALLAGIDKIIMYRTTRKIKAKEQ